MTSYTKGPLKSMKVQGAFAIVAPGNNTIAHVRDVYSDEHRTAPHDANLFALASELADFVYHIATGLTTTGIKFEACVLLAKINGEKVWWPTMDFDPKA
jgi:hypothetical protein